MAWTKSKNEKTKREVAWVFGVNLILNIIWSILYFGMHNPLWAFIDILLLMISIASMIFISWKVSKISSWLLLPYLIWIYFASVLNFMSI
jgi:tryptophan-rich sensory protein